ncbi:unnamed protein product [Merluccius merluccius]
MECAQEKGCLGDPEHSPQGGGKEGRGGEEVAALTLACLSPAPTVAGTAGVQRVLDKELIPTQACGLQRVLALYGGSKALKFMGLRLPLV